MKVIKVINVPYVEKKIGLYFNILIKIQTVMILIAKHILMILVMMILLIMMSYMKKLIFMMILMIKMIVMMTVMIFEI